MKTSSRFRLLLIELICNLCIFVLCALVCIALFTKANALSRESTDLTQGVYLAQTAAEIWKSGGQPDSVFGEYQITIESSTGADGLKTCDITVLKDAQVIYTLKEVTAFE